MDFPINKQTAQIIELLKKQNNRTGFVNKLPINSGLPIWDKLVIPTDSRNQSLVEGDDYIIIPLSSNGYSLSMVITGEQDSDSSYLLKWYTAADIYNVCHAADKNIRQAESLLALFMYIESSVYDRTDFYHIPKDLFPTLTGTSLTDSTKYIKLKHKDISIGIDQQTQSLIYWSCYYIPSGVCNCTGACDWRNPCPTMYCTATYCTQIEENPCPTCGGGGTGGGGTGGGGTGGGGTGGGGGGGGNCGQVFYLVDPCEPPPPPPVECNDFIRALESNTNFVGRMVYLNSNTVLGYDYEVGYDIRDVTQYNSNTYVPGIGSSTKPIIEWDFPPNTLTDGLIHSHYAGLNSIFTPDDVILMAQLFLTNHAKDPNNLFFALTSNYAVPFLMKVGDAIAYRTFCEKIVGTSGNDLQKMKDFADKFYNKINTNDPGVNETEFLKLIKEYGGQNGLILYRGTEDCNSWTKRVVDNFGNVTSVLCNIVE